MSESKFSKLGINQNLATIQRAFVQEKLLTLSKKSDFLVF